MKRFFAHYSWAFQWRWKLRRHNHAWQQAALQVARAAPQGVGQPVVVFNASTRLIGMSQNAGFSVLAAWALRLRGIPVKHVVCQRGMTRCVLGTQRDNPQALPPCADCAKQSAVVFSGADVCYFDLKRDAGLEQALQGMGIDQMSEFSYRGVPLGSLTLPALRWVLRRHHLKDDPVTRTLFYEYIISAWSVVENSKKLFNEEQPRAVVVFNGIAYPEAAVKWAAEQKGIPVVTHEVAHAPYTAFFSHGDATAYPIDVPGSFQLSDAQNLRLDAYLEQRFQGNFSMAGVRFWPEMRSLGTEFWQRAEGYQHIVPVFTNVIFDTSQSHANVVFEHMFAWLQQVLEIARAHPETLFVIRAHPDETRPGKESLESVADWVKSSGAGDQPNILFVPSGQFISSYELIQRAKFVMVYNSTIGLEAVLLGAAVLSGGKSRYTQLPMVYFPQTVQAHRAQAETFLRAERMQVPPEFKENARRFLYLQLYRVALPFDGLLEEDGIWRGYVRIKPFSLAQLRQPVFDVIYRGVVEKKPFVLEEHGDG